MTIANTSIYLLNEKASSTEILEALKQKTNNIHVLAAVAATEEFVNFEENIIQDYFGLLIVLQLKLKYCLNYFK